ncbi:sulfite exporter TauE/SafE family protein [Microvirga sp. CF3062]|uniref:sulfite exporter TauE/SafE family protein n=1 Tax=Microvirga sp. CF3062 TaxID=3110182 RepID=UPI002E78D15E|nr:sulfite exporter TauE/SafE family protein [Microvirga sp. CF3062]MEE1657232.1 sulfite exporter TauE/SafE family protein [Microvirga sp. CF3062]
MRDPSLWLILSIGLTFFLAGMVKGVTGMGLPTVAMGVLGALMAPVTAAALLIVPSFVTNVWQLFAGPNFTALVRRLWPMMLGIALGTVAGSFVLTEGNTRWTTAGLGSALVVYAGFTLLARQLSVPDHWEKWLSPLVGLTTGIVTGGTGVFVIPAVPYLQAFGLRKDDLIQALGLSFTVSTIALAVGLGWRGAFQLDGLVLSSLAIAPALAGMWLGQAVRRRVSPEMFRRWFLIGLLLLGAELVLRSVLQN